MEPKPKRYVTVQDAVDLLGIAERTVRRWMDEKRLHFIKDSTGHCRIDLDDIERELQTRSHIVSPFHQHRQEIQALVQELQMTVQKLEQRIEMLEENQATVQQPFLIHVSKEGTQEETTTFTVTELAQLVAAQPGVRLHPSSQRSSGIAGMIARRDLPEGTRRLVDFAKFHKISVHTIKQGYYEGKIALTIHQREGTVKRNHQEWWITQEQHQAVITYCQQHAIPYSACPQCQQQEERNSQAG